MQSSSETIQRLVQRIVTEVHPLRIILLHRRHIAQLLYQRIRGIARPFDIIVATPSDLEKHQDNIGLIYRTILQEGREVYAARTS